MSLLQEVHIYLFNLASQKILFHCNKMVLNTTIDHQGWQVFDGRIQEKRGPGKKGPRKKGPQEKRGTGKKGPTVFGKEKKRGQYFFLIFVYDYA